MKPYQERTDIEKIQSQWNKFTALHLRGECSAAIVRAATAAEIAANFAIREEFAAQGSLTAQFINNLLVWANGLSGKMDRILIPLCRGNRQQEVRKLRAIAGQINNKRNAILHQGEFCNNDEARLITHQSKQFIESLVQIYNPAFVLKTKIRLKRRGKTP